MDDAFAPKFKHLPALCARGNIQVGFALQRRHRDLAAERGHCKRNRHFAVEIVIVAFENLMRLNVDHDGRIAMWTPANTSLTLAQRTDAVSDGQSNRNSPH